MAGPEHQKTPTPATQATPEKAAATHAPEVHAGRSARGQSAELRGSAGIVQLEAAAKPGAIEEADKVAESVDLKEIAPNASKLLALAAMLQQQYIKMQTAAVARKVHNPFAKNTKNQMAAAATLVDMAKKVTEAAAALTDLAKKDGVALQYGGDKLGALANVLKAAALVSDLRNDAPAKKFMKDPGDEDAAAAWARHAAATFGRAADLIPGSTSEPGVPIAIPLTIFKGLLKAPSNYVNAFLTILAAHKDELDSAASLSKLNPKFYQGSVLQENLRWGGPLTNVYATAPGPLATHMTDARQRLKDQKRIDLWSASATVGRALLITDIESHAKEQDRARWVEHVKTH